MSYPALIKSLPIPVATIAGLAGLKPQTLRLKLSEKDARYKLTKEDKEALFSALKRLSDDLEEGVKYLRSLNPSDNII